ncbi:MAG TPA: kelch repeat-containing protein [Tepidisphaeraceae bacterium]|jgi:hypothetical protein
MSLPAFLQIESLEHRRHFASTAETLTPKYGFCPCSGCASGRQQQPTQTASLRASAVSAADVNVRINFAPSDAPRVRGHKVDYGAAFATRGNGLRYGWSSDRQDQTDYTDDPRYDNAKAESSTLMNGASWTIEVPNGWYNVHALMGTPSTLDAYYQASANGQPLVKGEPYEPNFTWIEGVRLLQVTNGKITITSGSMSKNNRLCSVAITAAEAPAPLPQGAGVNWERSSLESPLHRAEAGAVRVGDKLFVMGGFTNVYEGVTNRVDILDTKTGKWTRGAAMPGAQTHFGAATDGTSIYVAGGQFGPMLSIKGSNEVWRYDIAANTWSRFGELPAVRFGGSMAYLDGRLHFVGGNDGTRVRSRGDHFVFSLRHPGKGWTEAAPLPAPTDHHSTIVVNNKMYILGGETEHGTSYLQNDGFFEYDAENNAWNTLPPLPTASSHNEASTLTDGKRIFLIAGQSNQQELMTDVRSFDFKKMRWVEHTPLPTARKAGVSWIDGNRLFYMTGDDATYGEPKWTYEGVIGDPSDLANLRSRRQV